MKSFSNKFLKILPKLAVWRRNKIKTLSKVAVIFSKAFLVISKSSSPAHPRVCFACGFVSPTKICRCVLRAAGVARQGVLKEGAVIAIWVDFLFCFAVKAAPNYLVMGTFYFFNFICKD